ncbi:WD40-repeat-containing domain protein [Crepidotus variabilis]|uniref:WD40-repeat-containing domain protein n=1 Tax=Crepidotus variabilis TaxID=179855 RepID=A0A9P6EQ83_9AGAR|nr:WD40-repeat-containing domain protein [Crepidotus variabilis]
MKDAPLGSVQDTEELAYKLLASLPRDRLATIQRRIAPLLQFDLVRSLPTEISLQIFSYLPFQTLVTCALVSRRWRDLADDQSLWRSLCEERGWKWRSLRTNASNASEQDSGEADDSDDEGMGDSGDESEEEEEQFVIIDSLAAAKAELAAMHAELDSGFVSMSSISSGSLPSPTTPRRTLYFGDPQLLPSSSRNSLIKPRGSQFRHSPPSMLKSRHEPAAYMKPNYKLLHQSHVKLRNRFIRSNYRLSPLQTRGAPSNAHTSTVYCLQLYTYPETGKQVLFTGSRDKTIREWNLETGMVERIFSGVHTGSVLSLCADGGYLASAGSDRQVGVWRLDTAELVKTICDHEDSVLCVRFNSTILVSCSKDRTVRTYFFPSLKSQFVMCAHRAAVNAVSISESHIVSASGDRSVKLWDANTGRLLRTFDAHHTRGIAAIDFSPPVILSGSSDTHVRIFDMTTLRGWSTCLEHANVHTSSGAQVGSSTATSHNLGSPSPSSLLLCQSCGSNNVDTLEPSAAVNWKLKRKLPHRDLVRTVALGDEFVLSGSYDLTIKVWDKKTGALVADLTGGHTGRIFCIGFDSKKIVSCGEDQRICIWDFSHGIDTSFLA